MKLIALAVLVAMSAPAWADDACPPKPEPFKQWYIEHYRHGDPDRANWAGEPNEYQHVVIERLTGAMADYTDYVTRLLIACEESRAARR